MHTNSNFFLYFKKHQRMKFEWKLNPMPLKTKMMKLVRQSWLDLELTGKTWRECSQTSKNRIERFRFPSPNGTKPNELTRPRATLTSQQKYLPPPRAPLYNLKIVRNSLTHAPEIYKQHEPKGNLNRCHAPEIYTLHAIRNFSFVLEDGIIFAPDSLSPPRSCIYIRNNLIASSHPTPPSLKRL